MTLCFFAGPAQVVQAGGRFMASCSKEVTHVVSTQGAVDNGESQPSRHCLHMITACEVHMITAREILAVLMDEERRERSTC